MRKIPTLFKREFENHGIIKVLPELSDPSLEEVLLNGTATLKLDGACCAVIDGQFYKRFDAKPGRKIPEGAIPCQEEADPVTGHFPHWVKVSMTNPSDKWFVKALDAALSDFKDLPDGTYEAVGPHFQKNPHKFALDLLFIHGVDIVQVERTFEGIRRWLEKNEAEGLVFWLDGEPRAKIKRTDFGLEWPVN